MRITPSPQASKRYQISRRCIIAEPSDAPKSPVGREFESKCFGGDLVIANVGLVMRHVTLELPMFKKKHLFPLQAVLWTGFVLAMLLPVLGLLGPRPGAPLDERSLGVGEFWLIRIVETATPSGASWVMETNWLNLLLCATVGGVAITWMQSRQSGNAEQCGEPFSHPVAKSSPTIASTETA